MRAAIAGRSDALLVAEHGHDFRADLDGAGWHGAMNYAGFLRPVWYVAARRRLPDGAARSLLGLPGRAADARRRATAVAAMRAFRAGVPWPSVAALLDAARQPRHRRASATVAGSRERQLVGVGLQMTTPGVPMVFAGDELGLEGDWGEDARRTMPWDAAARRWDTALLDEYRALIALRRSSDALARGGIRYAARRPTTRSPTCARRADERLLCLAARARARADPAAARRLAAAARDAVRRRRAATACVLPGDGPAFHVWRLED